MLLKCCLISIIFLKNISCDDLAPEAKTTNIKKLSDSTNNPLTNRVQLTNDTGRYLNEYYVVINDQYIIKIFRLTYENYEIKSEKYPVLLVHGLFQSSDRFLQQRDNQSLAFKLQDFGYDVWLANFRGNKYGRRHTSFGDEIKDKAHFFNYSYEEIALQDIAATVDFILDNTKQEKIHYIGYSLGGTIFLVLNSMKQEYNNKFDTAHLLAPFGYQNYFPNKDLEVEASRCDEIYGIQSQGNKINETRGGSIKQIVHLAQNVKSKRFSRWDYGEKENEDHYGTKEPPKYNLSVITVETKIIFAPYDEYVSPKDIADMAANMVNATTREIGRKGIADMPTNMGNATSRKVEIEDVSGITTDTGNDRTRDVGRSGITDMPTNVSSATPREVTSMTTEDIDSTAIEVGEKGITDMPTDIGNAQSRVVEIEEVTGMTSIGDAATRKVGREGNPDVPTRMSYAILREVKHEDVTDMTTNIVEATTIGESTRDFKHNDFIDAPDVMELVYDNIINDLEKRSEHNAAIGRENKIKLSDNKTNTNEEETEDQQVKEKLRKTNWLIVALIPGLILFSLLLFMCLVRSIDFDCHMEM
ncbi:lipase 1-like isoform X2 [Cydia fagiglandana]|uniref:lipase 1-like isoform X2 n=1 Tax=Cydia fagiglandana TaxID=1458189 RepID=UPI002FEDF05C